MAWKLTMAHLLSPTPKKMRRLGNALAGASTSAAIPAMYADHKEWAVTIFLMGAVGKFLCEFFAEDTDAETKTP